MSIVCIVLFTALEEATTNFFYLFCGGLEELVKRHTQNIKVFHRNANNFDPSDAKYGRGISGMKCDIFSGVTRIF